MVSLISTLPENGFFKKDDQDSHLLFCQVITLVLQIQVTLGQKCKVTSLLACMSKVISGM